MIKAYQDAEKYSITNSVPSKTSRMGVTAPGAARSSDPNNSSIIILLQNTTTDVCIFIDEYCSAMLLCKNHSRRQELG